MPLRWAIAFLFFIACHSSAWAGWKSQREALDRHLASTDFRIFYTLEGPGAFPQDVPPATERATQALTYLDVLVAQLGKADDFYRNELGLRAPLAGPRYAAAHSIDIHILPMADQTGSTGDEIHTFRYQHFAPSPAALTIALSHRWQPTNLTPAHELFHAYQYGYTFFKNPWFLEGMARASEGFFRTATSRHSALPSSPQALDKLMQHSYRAETLWNRLIHLCGKKILKPILEAYGRLDRVAADARDIDPVAWPEKEQRSTTNNRYLLQGLLETLESSCSRNDEAELMIFKALLKSHGKRSF